MKLGRAFLPTVQFDSIEADCVFHSASVRASVTINRDGDITIDGRLRFFWDAGMNIRVGNTLVHLHPPVRDKELKAYVKKIKLVRDEIRLFLSESKKRWKNWTKGKLVKRVWLNPEEGKSGYTGYVAWNMDGYGGGRFSIADCQRTIQIWIDIYETGPGEYTQRQLDHLEAIAANIDLAVENIVELRKNFHAGDLHKLLPDSKYKLSKEDTCPTVTKPSLNLTSECSVANC